MQRSQDQVGVEPDRRAPKKRRAERTGDERRDQALPDRAPLSSCGGTVTFGELHIDTRKMLQEHTQLPPTITNGGCIGKPSLSLQAQASLFDHIVLQEIVDAELLDQIVASKSKLSQCQWLLPRYKKLITAGKARVEYKKPPFGRAVVTGSLGMHNMEKCLRHTLARHSFTDWDMTNAHPTILLQICLTHNIACENLRYYVVNREACLTDVMTHYNVSREQAKDLFLRKMFLGSFEAWAKMHSLQDCIPMPYIEAYSHELSRIARTIIEHNPAVVEYVGKKEKKNFEASVLSTFLQEIECRLLETLICYCLKQNLIEDQVAVLCNDGFMLETRLSRPELATEFNRLILERHGFDIQFATKPMNEFIPTEELTVKAVEQSSIPVSPLTLIPRCSQLNECTLNEPFDYIKIRRLLNSTIQFDSTTQGPESASTKKTKFTSNSREKLEKYSRLPTVTINEKEYAQIQYRRDCYGRCFPKRLGVQDMNKKIRHHLVGENLVDIDTVNSGASLLYNIVCLHPTEFGPSWNFPTLMRYVNEREQMLQETMGIVQIDREEAKSLFIRVMNGGGVPKHMNQSVTLQQFKAENASIAEIIVKANPELVEFVRTKKVEKNEPLSNLNASVLATYIFEWEQLVNETMYLYLKAGHYLLKDVCVLAYDGLMIPRESYHDGLLQELSKEVYEKLGLELAFVAKPMTEGVTEEQITANQSIALSDEAILSTRPKPRPPFESRSLPSWVPPPEAILQLINTHAFFAGAMTVTRKGGGHIYFMRHVVGATAWQCPIRVDCKERAGGCTIVTEHGLRYYCRGEECCKVVAATGQRKFNHYHNFKSHTSLDDDEIDIEPSQAVSSETKQERIKSGNFSKFLKWTQLEDGTRVPTNGDCYYMEGMKLIPCQDLDLKNGNTIFLKAAMGEGKTSVLKQLIRDLEAQNKDRRPLTAVSLVSRKSLCAEQASKLAEFDFVQYYDKQGPLSDTKTIVQLEASHRCEPPHTLQLLILDETIGLMEQIRSSKFTKASWRKFKLMLKAAHHVIVMDANIDDTLIQLIQRFRKNHTSLFYQNTNQRDRDTTVYHCRDHRLIIAKIVQSLKSDKKIVIATNTKTEADALEELIVETLSLRYRNKVFNYNANTSDAIKRKHFSNVNHHWAQLDVLIYTPTVNVGVSFEEHHFDEIFGIFTDCSTTAESSIQMMKRVRDIKSRRIHLCFHHCHQAALPTSSESIDAYILRTLNSSQIEYDPHQLLNWKVSAADFKTVRKIEKDAYYDTTVYLIAHTNESKNDFAARFIELGIENQGWLPERIIEMDDAYCQIHGLTKELLDVDTKALCEAKRTVTSKQHHEIAAARDLSEEEAADLEKKTEQHQSLDHPQKVALEKYKFAQFFGLRQSTRLITADYYSTYHALHIGRAYRNQCTAFQNGPDNVAILQYLHVNEKQLLAPANVRPGEEQDEFTFTALTTRRRFDEFRYALIIIDKLGLRHIWDSPNFQEDATSLAKEDLRGLLRTIFPDLWTELRDYKGKPILVPNKRQSSEIDTENDIARYFPQDITSEEWKKKNRQHNIEYMTMLYDLRRKDLPEWGPETSFASMLGLANSILKITFGIKLVPVSATERKRYVLTHCFHFRNSRFPSRQAGKGNGIRAADWPSLEWKQSMLSAVRPEDRPIASHETIMRLPIAHSIVVASASSPSIMQSRSPPENRSTEQSSSLSREKIILSGLHTPPRNDKKAARLQPDASKKRHNQTVFNLTSSRGTAIPLQGTELTLLQPLNCLEILPSEAIYSAIGKEVEALATPQKKIKKLKSTFQALYLSYVEKNTAQRGSFESQYANKVAASGGAKKSIFVLMRNYLRSLSSLCK